MAMKIKTILERAGMGSNAVPTGIVSSMIEDALDEISQETQIEIAKTDISIVKDQRLYDVLSDGDAQILTVTVKGHENDENKFRVIPRMMHPPKETDLET